MSFKEFEEILVYFSNSIQSQETEEEVAWDLAKNCISKLGFVDAVIYLLNEKGFLIQKAAYGPKNPRKEEIHKPIDAAK